MEHGAWGMGHGEMSQISQKYLIIHEHCSSKIIIIIYRGIQEKIISNYV
jgi:hypothetical protein